MFISLGKDSFDFLHQVAIHFNGEEVPAVRRGRLNARSGEVLAMLGKVRTGEMINSCSYSISKKTFEDVQLKDDQKVEANDTTLCLHSAGTWS